jgi:hypothetical protein
MVVLSSVPPTNDGPHISLVFREMWDTTKLPLTREGAKVSSSNTASSKWTGAPGSPKRTWAEKDGRSPHDRFRYEERLNPIWEGDL